MRKTLAIGLFALFSSTAVVSADTITIAADEWCPYNCAPASDKPGYMIEIAKIIFSEKGHSINYTNVNWSRALKQTREGKFDAVVGAAKGDAPDFVFPTASMGIVENSFFVASSSGWSYSGQNSLNGLKVGIIQDYDYGDLAVQLKKVGHPKISSGDKALEINFKKMVAGRLDALMEDLNVGNFKASEMGITNKVKFAGSANDPDDVFVAFSPKNPKSAEYAEILSKGIEQMRKDGRLAQLLAKYGLKDWQ